MKAEVLSRLGGVDRLKLVACLLLPLLAAAPKASGSCDVASIFGGGIYYYEVYGNVGAGCACAANVWGELGPTTSYGYYTFPITNYTFVGFAQTASFAYFLQAIIAPDNLTRTWHLRLGVSNCHGTNYSPDYTFLTYGSPTLVNQPQSQAVAPGGSVTFTASALCTENLLPVIFQWMTNGVPIPGATFTNNNTSASTSYTVTNVGPELNGVTYSVQAINHFMFANWQQSTGAVLTVNVPQPPVMQAQLSGGNVVISWPASAAGFGLETRVGVGPGAWTGAGGTVVTNGSTVSVALPASDGMRLFRLRHP